MTLATIRLRLTGSPSKEHLRLRAWLVRAPHRGACESLELYCPRNQAVSHAQKISTFENNQTSSALVHWTSRGAVLTWRVAMARFRQGCAKGVAHLSSPSGGVESMGVRRRKPICMGCVTANPRIAQKAKARNGLPSCARVQLGDQPLGPKVKS